MKQYLQNIADPTKFLGASDYPENEPHEPHEGFKWVKGEPSKKMTPYKHPTIHDQLDDVFESFPEITQSQYVQYIGTIEALMNRGKTDKAIAIVNSLSIDEKYKKKIIKILGQ